MGNNFEKLSQLEKNIFIWKEIEKRSKDTFTNLASGKNTKVVFNEKECENGPEVLKNVDTQTMEKFRFEKNLHFRLTGCRPDGKCFRFIPSICGLTKPFSKDMIEDYAAYVKENEMCILVEGRESEVELGEVIPKINNNKENTGLVHPDSLTPIRLHLNLDLDQMKEVKIKDFKPMKRRCIFLYNTEWMSKRRMCGKGRRMARIQEEEKKERKRKKEIEEMENFMKNWVDDVETNKSVDKN